MSLVSSSGTYCSPVPIADSEKMRYRKIRIVGCVVAVLNTYCCGGIYGLGTSRCWPRQPRTASPNGRIWPIYLLSLRLPIKLTKQSHQDIGVTTCLLFKRSCQIHLHGEIVVGLRPAQPVCISSLPILHAYPMS